MNGCCRYIKGTIYLPTVPLVWYKTTILGITLLCVFHIVLYAVPQLYTGKEAFRSEPIELLLNLVVS